MPLLNLCKTSDIAAKSGIHISRHIAHTTGWDALALAEPDDPLPALADQAAISAHIQHLKPYLGTDTVLLDYGCGYGRLALPLLQQQPLAGYIGLDSSYEMLQLLRDRADRLDPQPATPRLLLNADINDAPLQPNTIDVAVVSVVFRHNHKSVVKQAVRELARIIKPGGTVVVYQAFPRVWTLAGLQGQLYQMALNLLGRPFKNGPERYYAESGVKRLYRDFASVQLHPVGFAVIPPTMLILPRPLRPLWRTYVATPINTLLEKLTPPPLRRYFATDYDVVAKR